MTTKRRKPKCYLCDEMTFRVVTKQCKLCKNFVCGNHSSNFLVAFGCLNKRRVVESGIKICHQCADKLSSGYTTPIPIQEKANEYCEKLFQDVVNYEVIKSL